MANNRPAIAELEAILQQAEEVPVEILPNGEVTEKGTTSQSEIHNRKLLTMREKLIRSSLSSIDDGLSRGDPEATLEGLSEFMGIFGLSLRFSDFESFDRFMCETDDPLVL